MWLLFILFFSIIKSDFFFLLCLQNTPHRPSPSFSANSFVPLQAQVPRHQQANKSTSDNKAAVGEQHLQEVVSKLGTTNAGGIIVVDKSSVTTSLQNENVCSFGE